MRTPLVYLLLFVVVLGLVACGGKTAVDNESGEASTEVTSGMGPGMMGSSSMGGMMARHNATIPENYAGMQNPVQATDESIARGADIYATNCATCHGDGGMGDGPAGEVLNPSPAPIAHTSQMLGDDYLFWQISEGGAMEPFNSAMIAWKGVLDENQRWDVINYVQALGSGRAEPASQLGGEAYDPTAEAVRQKEMLAKAVEQGIINQEEADLFAELHPLVDENTMSGQGMMGNMSQNMNMALSRLISAGSISQTQADSFLEIHDRLVEAGLMN